MHHIVCSGKFQQTKISQVKKKEMKTAKEVVVQF